jgi:hypothetical protein
MSDQEKNLKDEDLDKVSGGVDSSAGRPPASAAREGSVSIPIEVPKTET